MPFVNSPLAVTSEPQLAFSGSACVVQVGAEYNKKDYAFQSSGVVSTLQDLLKQFREERNQGQEEWKKTKQAMAAMGDLVHPCRYPTDSG